MDSPKRRFVSNEEFEAALRNTDNDKIIKKVLSQYINVLSKEDLHDCGLHGLWRCLGYHRDGMGKLFTTNLWWFVDNECKRILKKNSTKNVVSICNDIEAKNENEDLRNHLLECIDLLKPKYKQVLIQYYFEKRTMDEIGRLNNYSKETASQNIKKAMSRLREIYVKQM
jgi:RNA polymerase sigma factor (sigma-70 family)